MTLVSMVIVHLTLDKLSLNLVPIYKTDVSHLLDTFCNCMSLAALSVESNVIKCKNSVVRCKSRRDQIIG